MTVLTVFRIYINLVNRDLKIKVTCNLFGHRVNGLPTNDLGMSKMWSVNFHFLIKMKTITRQIIQGDFLVSPLLLTKSKALFKQL